MIARIIDWCTANRFLVLTATLVLTLWGLWAVGETPLDAVPDISDVQVIVATPWEGRSPDLIEDQVTYPIVTSLLSTPRVRTVRAVTDFGMSYVYVIFEDGTDMYWARSRVVEYLQGIRGLLPDGVNPAIGPDATGVGWVFEYALVDETGTHNLAELRSFQDWHLRYWLASVPGVAEVATIGGFVKQYQVNIDPNRLAAYDLSVTDVVRAIRASNNDVAGRLLEFAGREYMVRSRGYLTSADDIRQIDLGVDAGGTPVRVDDVAQVRVGPDIRRGVAELDGRGEVVGGIVVMRFGENALQVIDRVKAKLREVESSLPAGVTIVPTYDRSRLIRDAIGNLGRTLVEEAVVVSIVIVLFLWHVRSALVPILVLPIAVVASFVPMYYLGVNANIMSLGGIALAIGVLVDAAIVMVENAYRRVSEADYEEATRAAQQRQIVVDAAKQVGRPIFLDLNVIQRLGERIEQIAQGVEGTRSVYAERVAQGYFTDINIDRAAIARYGLTMADVQDVIQYALGGQTVTRTVEGRERYPVNVRYARSFRETLPALQQVPVRTPTGAHVPLGQLASIELTSGPAMVRDEDGQLAGYVYVDTATRDVGGVCRSAQTGHPRTADLAGRLHAGLDRAIRVPGAGSGTAAGAGSNRLSRDLHVALCHVSIGVRGRGGHAVGRLCDDRRCAPAMVARLQLFGRGVGRLHRALWRGGADRGPDGDLPA